MQVVAENLADAVWFEVRAAKEPRPEVRAILEKQATRFRELAEARAKELGKPLPDRRLYGESLGRSRQG